MFTMEAAKGSDVLLRFEDIDAGRCRPEYYEAIDEDLSWIGFKWTEPPIRQSDRRHHYEAALESLKQRDLLYPCFCTRAQILDEEQRIAAAPHGPDGPHYAGTCRRLSSEDVQQNIDQGKPFSLRLKIDKAMSSLGRFTWYDQEAGLQQVNMEDFGDIVLARKDSGLSYHLCSVVDDHLQQIELVTRGQDLMPSTSIHRLLQELLNFTVPQYHHHKLVADENGLRLAKRRQDLSIRDLRASGLSPIELLNQAQIRLV
jgi:glutamyl-Q tRNA(Asp) synthetase